MVRVIGEASIAHPNREFPIFKHGKPDPDTGKVEAWWLWDGEEEWRASQPASELSDLPYLEIVADDQLHRRVASGWVPSMPPWTGKWDLENAGTSPMPPNSDDSSTRRMLRHRITPLQIAAYHDQSWVYDTWPPNGETHIVCPSCGGLVLTFEKLSGEVKRTIASMYRDDRFMPALRELQAHTDCLPGHAKGALIHIRAENAACH